jgi:hypothetical protein
MSAHRGTESGAVVGPTVTTGTGSGAGTAPPPLDQPERLVAWQLIGQARACQIMGSPLYTHLLATAAQDVLAGGPTAELLVPRARPARGDAAALRFMAAVHRLVLTRRVPRLAFHYPTVGGTGTLAGAAAPFLAAIADERDTLVHDLERPCQTNEVGRAAGLLLGMLDASAVTALPLSLREVGAAAGLNLRLDAWRYELPDGVVVGEPASEVVLHDRWRGPVPHADAPLRIVDRRGGDRHPIDPTTAAGRLALSASVWGDQIDRFERLGAALRIAARMPVTVDEALAAAWVRAHAQPVRGRCTVLFHSIVEEYLSAEERVAFHAAVEDAGTNATADAPFAWVRMEPSSELRHHTVSIRLWPQAPELRQLARTGAHGDEVTPLDGPPPGAATTHGR